MWLASGMALEQERVITLVQASAPAPMPPLPGAACASTSGHMPGPRRQVLNFLKQSQSAHNVTAASRGYRTYAQAGRELGNGQLWSCSDSSWSQRHVTFHALPNAVLVGGASASVDA